MSITWVLEDFVMPDVHERLRHAAEALGHRTIVWQDHWVTAWPELDEEPKIFHGSLGTAARVHADSPWPVGAYCDVTAFHCSAYYERAREWLLHREWVRISVQEFVDDPDAAFQRLGSPAELFVRPDSPLKPFAGRVLQRENVSLAALDHGYYFDDTSIDVILAPVRNVEREWRYVVVDGRVVAGSAYTAADRSPRRDDPSGAPWKFAAEVAEKLQAPEMVYVLDVCEADGRLWLIELNPFSGADLYACDLDAVVAAVAEVAHCRRIGLFEAHCRTCDRRIASPDFEAYGEGLFWTVDGRRCAWHGSFGDWGPFEERVLGLVGKGQDHFWCVLAALADPVAGTALTGRRVCSYCRSTDFLDWGQKHLGFTGVVEATFERSQRLTDEELTQRIAEIRKQL